MAEFAPRESLYERVARLSKDRRAQMLFGLAMLGPLVQVASNSWRLGTVLPIAACLVLAVAFVIRARMIVAKREAAGMERRKVSGVTMHRLRIPTRWKQLNEAVAGYRALTGREPPSLAYKARADTAERIDAELAFVSTVENEQGVRPVVSAFDAVTPSEPWCAFNEAMLDTYSAAELLAVMVHLMYRAEFARGETARLANGVCEADSKTLLLTREHVALLRAIEKSTCDRKTPAPGMGILCFADADLLAGKVTGAGVVARWATRDRLAELRAHLGAMALDVPAGG